MEATEGPSELIKAFIKAQAKIQNAKTDSKNPHFGSDYASLEAVLHSVKKPLNDNGLAIVQLPFQGSGGFLGLTTRIYHTSGEFIESQFHAPLQKDNAQAVGSALTYLRRYALMAMVGIAPTDDDGEAAVQHKRRRGGPDQQDIAMERAQADFPDRGERQKPSTAGDYDPTGDTRPVTEKQIKRLYAKSQSIRATKDEMVSFMGKYAGVGASKELNREQIDKLFKIMETCEAAGDHAHDLFMEYLEK